MKINNEDRSQWIDNDEGLYLDWKRSKKNKREYIKENREMIDDLIRRVVNGQQRPHSGVYGC